MSLPITHFTAVLADDEPLMRANLREQLASLWPDLVILGEAEDGPGALDLIFRQRPRLAFLDIQMPGMTGLEVAKLIPPATQVVFVTAFNQHALDAFEVHALDYLVKPIQVPRLAKLIARLQSMPSSTAADPAAVAAALSILQTHVQAPGDSHSLRQGATQGKEASAETFDWLPVDTGTQVRLVHIDDVMYFESDNKYTRVVAEDCDGLIRRSLRELMDGLTDRPFAQIHRSVVVNKRFVRSVIRVDGGMELEVKGRSERLKISAAHQHLFKPL